MKRKSNSKYKGYGSYSSDLFDEREYKKYRPSRLAQYTGAAVGAGHVAGPASELFGTIAELAPNVESMFVGGEIAEGLGTAITVGGAIGTGGAVAAAAGVGYLVGSAINSMFTQTEIESTFMPGTYQGKFKLSAGAAFKGLRDQYQKQGCCFIIETFGAVADPDLVYIGHSSWNAAAVINAIAGALLRKLFRVGCRLDPQTTYEVLSLSSPDASGSAGFIINYEWRLAAGGETRVAVVIPANSSIDTLINYVAPGPIAISLYNLISSQLKDNNPSILTKIRLYQENHLLYEMNLEKEVLHLAMSSHMVVQNRTKSVSGSSSTDLIDTQPLKGPVYEFTIGTPKIKAETPIRLNQMENEGIILARASQFGGSDVTAYKEPPVKKLFQNCNKSAYVRLNPGALKSMTVGADMKGYFNNVLFKLRYNTQDTQTKQCFGKSQLVCLEEELNSGSANNISVHYECQHIAGASLVTTKNGNMQPGYAASEVNNVPA